MFRVFAYRETTNQSCLRQRSIMRQCLQISIEMLYTKLILHVQTICKQTSKTTLQNPVVTLGQTGSTFVDLISQSYSVLRLLLHIICKKKTYYLVNNRIKSKFIIRFVFYLGNTCCISRGFWFQQGSIVLLLATLSPFEFLYC